jgi:hypothetical protein
MTYAHDHQCRLSIATCSHQMRTCACLRRSILGLLECTDTPLTTEQIIEMLQLRSFWPNIYSVLFAMEFEGLVDCLKACPWTWTAADGVSPMGFGCEENSGITHELAILARLPLGTAERSTLPTERVTSIKR